MSVRFTSGNVGRLTFEHANRMADAADAVESMPTGDRIATVPIRPDFIVARLTSKAGMTLPPDNFEVWNWTEMGVTGTRQSRVVAPIPKGLVSSQIGEMPIGRAIRLAGSARVKDIVTIFPMKDQTGESWYGFVGRPELPQSMTSVLQIIDAIEIAPKVWKYMLRPVYMDDQGNFSTNPLFVESYGYNLYEVSGLHGQGLQFSNPDGRLVVEGPVSGPVLGIVASAPDQPVVWAFEAPLPLKPTCGGPTPGAQAMILRGGL